MAFQGWCRIPGQASETKAGGGRRRGQPQSTQNLKAHLNALVPGGTPEISQNQGSDMPDTTIVPQHHVAVETCGEDPESLNLIPGTAPRQASLRAIRAPARMKTGKSSSVRWTKNTKPILVQGCGVGDPHCGVGDTAFFFPSLQRIAAAEECGRFRRRTEGGVLVHRPCHLRGIWCRPAACIATACS